MLCDFPAAAKTELHKPGGMQQQRRCLAVVESSPRSGCQHSRPGETCRGGPFLVSPGLR